MVKPVAVPTPDSDTQTFWVVFSDETDLTCLKILKRGFRHCFVIMQQSGRWLLIDPRANVVEVNLLPHPDHFNLPRYFTGEGKIVCKIADVHPPKKIAPLFPMSCVETVKRVIGLHHRFIFTPYQLYRHLTQDKKG